MNSSFLGGTNELGRGLIRSLRSFISLPSKGNYDFQTVISPTCQLGSHTTNEAPFPEEGAGLQRDRELSLRSEDTS